LTIRKSDRHRHRLQVLAVVVQFSEQGFGGRERRCRVEKRVSIRCGTRRQFIGDAGAGARLVFDDELLAQAARQLLGENAQRDIVGPAGPVRRHQPHQTRRPIGLGQRLDANICGEEAGRGAQQSPARDVHGVSSELLDDR
jgi:hypothetical protein